MSLPPATRGLVLSIVGANHAGRITGNSCAPERYETGRRGSYSPGPMPPGYGSGPSRSGAELPGGIQIQARAHNLGGGRGSEGG